jgi:hypothetical protein
MLKLILGFHLFILHRWIQTCFKKEKMQVTIRKMFGWTKAQTSKTQNDSKTHEETHNTHLEQQLNGNFGSFSNDDLDKETNEVEEEANDQKKIEVQTKRNFCME